MLCYRKFFEGLLFGGLSLFASLALAFLLIYSRGETLMIGKHILLTILVGGGMCVLFWRYPPESWTPLRILGTVLLVVGFFLWTIARFQLGASFSVKAEARQLVTRGIYSKVRNPIYISGLSMIAGAVLMLNRPIWLLTYLFLIPLQMWRAKKEAQVLEAKFGEEYRKYRAGTWF